MLNLSLSFIWKKNLSSPPQDSHAHYKEHWCNWETFFQLQIGLDMYKPCNWRLSRSKFMGALGLSLQWCLTRFNVTWNIRQPGSSTSLIIVLSSRVENVLIQDRTTKLYFKSQNSFHSSDWAMSLSPAFGSTYRVLITLCISKLWTATWSIMAFSITNRQEKWCYYSVKYI